MTTLLPILIFSLIILTLLAQTSIYVDQNSSNTSANGSKENPYASMERAVQNLGPADSEIILLGTVYTLKSPISFLANYSYVIRPYLAKSGDAPFKIRFDKGAYIIMTKTSLTVQDMQIIDLDNDRDVSTIIFTATDAILNLNGVQFSNVYYSSKAYVLVYAASNTKGNTLTISNSTFTNLTNVAIYLDSTTTKIKNSTFSHIAFDEFSFFAISGNAPGQDVIFEDVIVEDIIIGYTLGILNFVRLSSCDGNVTFQNLTLRKATIASESYLIGYTSSNRYPHMQIIFTMNDTKLENVYEKKNSLSYLRKSVLILSVAGSSRLDINRLYLDRVLIKYSSLILYQSIVSYLDSQMNNVFPIANIDTVKIEHSTNTNFLFFTVYAVNIKNVELNNNGLNDTFAKFSMFYVNTAEQTTIRNFDARNQSGSVFSIDAVTVQEFYNCTFDDIRTSQDFNQTLQNIVRINRTIGSEIQSVSKLKPMTIFQDFHGFSEISGMNSSQESNDSYAIVMISETGKVYIKDTTWFNLAHGGFLATAINFLEVDNLTVSSNPLTPIEEIPWHRIFQFINILELHITNSRFFNLQNVLLMSYFSVDITDLYGSTKLISLTFDSITVSNNSASYNKPSSRYGSLFDFKGFSKPVVVSFTNSEFRDNKIVSGIIQTSESYHLDLYLLNSFFRHNLASSTASVLSAQIMQQNANKLQIANNIFKDNSCSQQGGLISLVDTWHNLTLLSNSYMNNSAQEGGVGYVLSSVLEFYEYNGTYFSNSANTFGGAWYISASIYSAKRLPISFSNTRFLKSSANRGGALYVSTGNFNLNGCLFMSNEAEEAGADMYIGSFSSANISNTQFYDSQSQKGTLLFVESLLNQQVTFKRCHVANIDLKYNSTTLVDITSGSLIVLDTTFEHITSSLFNVKATSVYFQNIKLDSIQCPTAQTFCILQGSQVSLELLNSKITNVISNGDLIALSQKGNSLTMSNVLFSQITAFTINSQSFVCNINSTNAAVIENSNFNNLLGFSGIKFFKCEFNMLNNTFLNSFSPIIVEKLQHKLRNKRFSRTQFVSVNSSIGVFKDNKFARDDQDAVGAGGGIFIGGNSGEYQILDCFFKGNRARNGGAISILGNSSSVKVSSSTFMENSAILAGGAIYFANNSIGTVSVIDDATLFINNYAYIGGAVYFGNVSTIVKDSIFTQNNASHGGAIASFGDKNSLEYIYNSEFLGNRARIGPVIRALGAMNFVLENDITKNNVATFGGDIAANPDYMRLVIYEVDRSFIYLANVTYDYMIAYHSTTVVFNSSSDSNNVTLVQQTGKTPNYLYVFTCFDKLGQPTPVFEGANVKISIKNSDLKGDLTLPNIIGNPTLTFNTTPSYIFNSFSVRGSLGTQVTLTTQLTYRNQFINQTDALPPIEYNITLGPCSIGDIYDKDNNLCSPCSSGTYSLKDPYEATSCNSCPPELNCLGGSVIYPLAGYWRSGELSMNVQKCFNDQACLGGSIDYGREINRVGFCGPGYQGVACACCSRGFAKFGTGQRCADCQTNVSYYLRFLIYLAIQIGVIIFTAKVYLATARLENSDKKINLIKATLIKLIIDFVQVLNIISQLNLSWPAVLERFIAAFTKITPSNDAALSINCFIALAKGDNRNTFFIKALVLMLQPILYILGAIAIWSLVYKLSRKPIFNNKELRIRILLTSIIIVYILQPGVIRVTLELFQCRNFGSSLDLKNYLVHDTNIQCWSSDHIHWALGIGIPSLLMWFFIPVLLMIHTALRFRSIKNNRCSQLYALLGERYHYNPVYFEMINLLKKILLILASLFITFVFLQAYLCFIIIAVALIIQITFKPFFHRFLNNVEKFSLFTLGFILYTCTFFTTDGGTTSTDIFLLVLDMIVGIIFILYCLYIAVILVRKKLFNLSKKIEKILIREDSQSTFTAKVWRKLTEGFKTDHTGQFIIEGPENQIEAKSNKIKSKEQQQNTRLNSPTKNKYLKDNYLFLSSLNTPKSNSTSNRLSNVNHNGVLAFNMKPYFKTSQDSSKNIDNFILRMASKKISSISSLSNTDSIFIKDTPQNRTRSSTTMQNQALNADKENYFTLETFEGINTCSDVGLITVPEEITTFKKSDFQDNRLTDINKFQVNDQSMDHKISETNSQDDESDEKDKVISLYDVITEHSLEPPSGTIKPIEKREGKS